MNKHFGAWLGAAITLVLQIVLAPAIHIGYAYPNFLLIYVLICSLVFPHQNNLVLAFVLGFIFDLIGSGPVGAMALVCVVISYAATSFLSTNDNDTVFLPLITLAIALLIAQFLYACLCIACGWDVPFAEALVYRVLPCWLYDTVIGLVAFPLIAMLFHREKKPNDVSVIT